MVNHISFGAEALAAALRAVELLLAMVNLHVDLKILLLSKSLCAVGQCTFEGLSTVMEVSMGNESDPATEAFPTAIEIASKGLFLTLIATLTLEALLFLLVFARGFVPLFLIMLLVDFRPLRPSCALAYRLGFAIF